MPNLFDDIFENISNKLQQELFELVDRNVSSDIALLLSRSFLHNKVDLEVEKDTILKLESCIKFNATADSLLGVYDQRVEVVFFTFNNQVECLIRATLPKDWTFEWGYFDLPDYTNYAQLEKGNSPSFFYDLRFAKPFKIVFSSYDFQQNTIPSTLEQKPELLDSTLDHEKINYGKIHQGLNYISAIDLGETENSLLHPLLKFSEIKEIELPHLSFYGHLTLEDEREQIRLVIDLNLNKRYQDIFNIGISSLVLHTSVSLYQAFASAGITFIGGLTIGEHVKNAPDNVAIDWLIGSTNLIVRNAKEIAFPGFDTFSDLVEGKIPSTDDSFPIPSHSLNTLSIRDFSLYLSLDKVKVDYISFGVGTASEWQHSFLDGAIVVEDLLLEWEVFLEPEKRVRFDVFGDFRLGGGLVSVSAIFPDYVFSGELALYETIDLKQIFQHFLPKAPLPEVTILDLAITANTKQSQYDLELDIASDWKIPLGKEKYLILERLGIQIEKDALFTFATIDCVLNIVGIDLILSATNANTTSAGWTFSGRSGSGNEIPLGIVIEDLAKIFGVGKNFPKSIKGLIIENIAVQFDTDTKNFYFTCESIFEIESEIVDIVLNINIIRQQDGSYDKHFEGLITIDNLSFALIFDTKKDSTTFIGEFNESVEKEIDVKELVGSISPDWQKEILEGLKFCLKDALFIYTKQTQANFLLGLDIGNGINLSKLPLVGKEFTPGESIKIAYKVLIAKSNLTSHQIENFEAIYAGRAFDLPSEGITKRLDLATTIQFGTKETKQLDLPISINKDSGKLEQVEEDSSQPASTTNPPADVVSPDGMKWFMLQKTFGVVHFERLGYKYQNKNKKIWFALDAALQTKSLTISLDGLGVESPLTKLEPKFHLKGIGIDYQSGGTLEIGGAFLRKQIKDSKGKTYEYDGAAIIKTETFAISAIGSYARYEEHPSLFIYAVLDYPLGGPGFFFVTGLAAGFGYNRSLKVPGIEGVATFPLVEEAIHPDTSTDSKDQTARLEGELNKIQQYIPPATGEMFLAVGIKFTSFKIVDSFILLTLGFGDRFELNILGLSTLIAPPEVGADITPVAEVQLALKASFLPQEGIVAVRAQLTNNSFILSKKCHLTGGFAFYTWFAPNEHQGDFVLTLGGYHSLFKVPAHYPKVPPLALNWRVNDELLFKADAYFALTASALMTGGHIQATWESGSLKAWFNAGLDFLIAWKPYHYEASVYIDMGVSYTYHLFGTHHLNVSIGANLHIWGPEFSGIAKIHLWIVSFTIRFGEDKSEPQSLSWKEFKNSFLPQDSEVCTVVVRDGLVGKTNPEEESEAVKDDSVKKTDSEDKSDLGVINPKHLCLAIDSFIPIKQVEYSQDEYSQDKNSKPSAIDVGKHNKNFGIAAMNISSSSTLKSTLKITIARNYKNLSDEEFRQDFQSSPILKKAPTGLWGESFEPDLNGKQFIENTLSGLEIKPKQQHKAGETHSIARDALQFNETSVNNAYRWQEIQPFEAISGDRKTSITNTIVDAPVKDTRAKLLKALGLDSDEIDLSQKIPDDFLSPPQVKATASN